MEWGGVTSSSLTVAWPKVLAALRRGVAAPLEPPAGTRLTHTAHPQTEPYM